MLQYVKVYAETESKRPEISPWSIAQAAKSLGLAPSSLQYTLGRVLSGQGSTYTVQEDGQRLCSHGKPCMLAINRDSHQIEPVCLQCFCQEYPFTYGVPRVRPGPQPEVSRHAKRPCYWCTYEGLEDDLREHVAVHVYEWRLQE